jgi:hypothetical protein
MKNLKLYENFNSNISEGLRYHIKSDNDLLDNVFRYGSDKYMSLFNEARNMYNEGMIELNESDIDVLKTDIGMKDLYEGQDVWLDIPFEVLDEAEYQGKKVDLNKPKRGGSKKFYVYVKNAKGNVIKVAFGAKSGGASLSVKLQDPEAKANFAKRHKCSTKNDKTTPGYWSCRLPRYAKQLGLSGGGKWW